MSVTAAAHAFGTERKEVLPPPDHPPAEASDTPAATQPFAPTPPLPEGYKPSRSAIDPVEPDPNNPATSPLPPSYQGEGLPQESTEESSLQAGPPPPDIITAQPDPRTYIATTLQGLDKVTARRQQFDATMGTVTSFGNLEIVPRACWQSPAEDKPDSAALLEIWQWKPGEKPSFVFFGWMFSSSPGLSSLEHPIYDLTVLKCVQDPKELKEEKQKQNDAAKEESSKKTLEQEVEKGKKPAPEEEELAPLDAPLLPSPEGELDINAPQPD